jgi:hypothetical protein
LQVPLYRPHCQTSTYLLNSGCPDAEWVAELVTCISPSATFSLDFHHHHNLTRLIRA